MDKLVQSVAKSLIHNFTQDVSITIALSGGVDSVALLHIIHRIIRNYPIPIKVHLDAIHINHGISINSTNWAKFCKNLCQNLGIPITISEHKIRKNGGESLENNARQTRYKEFFKHQTDTIALAHHKTDQVETTLTQIFRGSDLHNIAAMRPITQKQDKIFWRPFLDFTKHDLEEYVELNGLTYIVDESNHDNQYLRNFIRNRIIPELNTWDKHIDNKILKINEQIQNNLALTDEIAKHDLHNCSNPQDYSSRIDCKHSKPDQSSNTGSNSPKSIDFDKFKTLSFLRQINLIHYFILKNNKPLPSNKQINEFIRQLNTCQIDKSPSLQLNATSSITMQKKTIFIKETLEKYTTILIT